MGYYISTAHTVCMTKPVIWTFFSSFILVFIGRNNERVVCKQLLFGIDHLCQLRKKKTHGHFRVRLQSFFFLFTQNVIIDNALTPLTENYIASCISLPEFASVTSGRCVTLTFESTLLRYKAASWRGGTPCRDCQHHRTPRLRSRQRLDCCLLSTDTTAVNLD